MVALVEGPNLMENIFYTVRNIVKGSILRRDEAALGQMILYEVLPRPPIVTARFIQHDDWDRMSLARLNEGQTLEPFIVRPESSGQQDQCTGLLDKEELSGEEVTKIDQFLIIRDGLIGLLLEGQKNVQTKTHFASGSEMSGSHHSAAGTRDHHYPALGQALAQFYGHLELGVGR